MLAGAPSEFLILSMMSIGVRSQGPPGDERAKAGRLFDRAGYGADLKENLLSFAATTVDGKAGENAIKGVVKGVDRTMGWDLRAAVTRNDTCLWYGVSCLAFSSLLFIFHVSGLHRYIESCPFPSKTGVRCKRGRKSFPQ